MSKPNEEKLAISEYKTHFKDHYERKVSRYLLCKSLKRNSLPLAISITYVGFFTLLINLTIGLALFIVGMVLFFSFFISSFLIILYPQKSKNVLAYHLWKASQFFHAYNSETNDKRAKLRFLEQSKKHVRLFGKYLHFILENSNISLKLPDINELKLLHKNVMERIYPLIQDGKNPNDILLLLSKIFFDEVDYKKIPKLNATIEQTYAPQSTKDIYYDSISKIRQSTLFKCVISDAVILISIFGGIYALKYPIALSEYWVYLGNNAATVIAGVVGSALAVILFFYRGKQKN